MLSLTGLRSAVTEGTWECCFSDQPPYSGVLLSSILLHGVLILLSGCCIKGFWGNSTSLQTLEPFKLCSATENEWVLFPGLIGDGEATVKGKSPRTGGRPSGEKSTSISLIS